VDTTFIENAFQIKCNNSLRHAKERQVDQGNDGETNIYDDWTSLESLTQCCWW